MQITEKLKIVITTDRLENDCEYYTDKVIEAWIKRRFSKLCDIEGAEVWMENDVFFIEDPTDRKHGFKRYKPESKESKQHVDDIIFLMNVILCF